MAGPQAAKNPQGLLHERLQNCERHLTSLGAALTFVDGEPDRCKRLGAELRALVCANDDSGPLLLDLMDDYGVEYFVEPNPDFPFPITMVEDVLNPPDIDRDGLSIDEISGRHRAHARPVVLRSFIDDALAVWIRPHAFSYRDLILAVARQTPATREYETDGGPLVELERFVLADFSGYAAPMRVAATHALRAGDLLIGRASSAETKTPFESLPANPPEESPEEPSEDPSEDPPEGPTEEPTEDRSDEPSKTPRDDSAKTPSSVSAPRTEDWGDPRVLMSLGLRAIEVVSSMLERALDGSDGNSSDGSTSDGSSSDEDS